MGTYIDTDRVSHRKLDQGGGEEEDSEEEAGEEDVQSPRGGEVANVTEGAHPVDCEAGYHFCFVVCVSVCVTAWC